MFKIATTPAYWTTVTVDLPSDAGKTDRRKFEAKFKRHSAAELEKLAERARNGQATDDEIVREVMLDWRGITGEDGQELEFNDAHLAALLDIHPVRPTIVTAFFESVRGGRAKN